jgi:hypothetical protein
MPLRRCDVDGVAAVQRVDLLLHVADHADDSVPLSVVRAGLETLTDRIVFAELGAREALVDHDGARGAGHVVRVEVAPAQAGMRIAAK